MANARTRSAKRPPNTDNSAPPVPLPTEDQLGEKTKHSSSAKPKDVPIILSSDLPPADPVDEPLPGKKHGRKPGGNNAPPSKKPKPAPVAKPKKEKKSIAIREPLPDREGRNVHPGAAKELQKATRRNSQGVEAERIAKREAALQKIREAEIAKHLLAQMDVEEENADQNLRAIAERRLSVALRKRARSEVEDSESEGESFEKIDSDEDSGDDASDKGQPPAKRKAVSDRPGLQLFFAFTYLQLFIQLARSNSKGAKKGIRDQIGEYAEEIRGQDNSGKKKNKAMAMNGVRQVEGHMSLSNV